MVVAVLIGSTATLDTTTAKEVSTHRVIGSQHYAIFFNCHVWSTAPHSSGCNAFFLPPSSTAVTAGTPKALLAMITGESNEFLDGDRSMCK